MTKLAGPGALCSDNTAGVAMAVPARTGHGYPLALGPIAQRPIVSRSLTVPFPTRPGFPRSGTPQPGPRANGPSLSAASCDCRVRANGEGHADACLEAGTNFVHWIDGSGARNQDVGGKAVGLDQLVAEGFPVPPTAVVTSQAYAAFVAVSGLEGRLAHLSGRDLPRPDDLLSERRQVDRLFLDAMLPANLESAIKAVARQLLERGRIAVRSSATVEDSSSASSAGQYRTVLDIATESGALDAVKLCWASLWAPSARAYRIREGVDDDAMAMAVVIQSMVAARHAGVVFTVDPFDGPDVVRVEVVEGLGEALVSGKVTPHAYLIDRDTLSVGRVSPDAIPGFLEDLTRMSLRAEARLGVPLDIEWAHDGDSLFLLQARPITARHTRRSDDDGFDTLPEDGAIYTPTGLAEMLPGVLPPLLWTINAPMLDGAFRRLFADLDIAPQPTAGAYMALGRFRGRAALNLTALRRAAASMPGGAAAEVDRQYLGRALIDDERDDHATASLLGGFQALRVRRELEDDVALLADAVDFVLALGVDPTSLSVQRFLSYRDQIRDLAWRGYEAEVASSAAAAAAYRALQSALGRWVGPSEAAIWSQRLTTAPATQTRQWTSRARALWALYVEGVRGMPSCSDVLAGPVESMENRLEALGVDGAQLMTAVRRTVRHLGSRSVYGGPTWDEDERTVWGLMGSIAACDFARTEAGPELGTSAVPAPRAEALAELYSMLRRSWRWRLTRILTGQVVDLRRRMIRKLADDAFALLGLRETAKRALLILGGEEHRLINEAARRLVASGMLASRSDVMLLADEELRQMLQGVEPLSDDDLTRRRDVLAHTAGSGPLPDVFEGVPGAEPPRTIDGDRFDGWAASQGTARGVVRVVSSIEDGRRLQPGDILVAHSTDAAWTPLFLNIGGIVLEQGGPLSHAAIVAREFGVPAVLNVKGATRLLKDGELAEVDGTAGVVTRVSKAPT